MQQQKIKFHVSSNKHEKGLVFAYDTTFALDGTFNSFHELNDVLEAFKSVSGLKFNNENTVIRIGSLRIIYETF